MTISSETSDQKAIFTYYAPPRRNSRGDGGLKLSKLLDSQLELLDLCFQVLSSRSRARVLGDPHLRLPDPFVALHVESVEQMLEHRVVELAKDGNVDEAGYVIDNPLSAL